MARGISIKSAENIEMARRAGQLAAQVLSIVEPYVVPGVSTETLDRICREHILNVQGAIPANVGYQGTPKPSSLLSTTWFATAYLHPTRF